MITGLTVHPDLTVSINYTTINRCIHSGPDHNKDIKKIADVVMKHSLEIYNTLHRADINFS